MTRSADQAEGRGSPLTHSKNVVPSGTFLFHLFIRRSFLARLLASVHSGSSTGQLTCPIYYDRNHVGVGARAGPTRKKAAPNHARARTRMAAKGCSLRMCVRTHFGHKFFKSVQKCVQNASKMCPNPKCVHIASKMCPSMT